MKFSTRYLLVLACLLLSGRNLHAQWTQTGGPEGGVINALVASDTLLFAGTDVGLFRSTDEGDHWEWIDIGLTEDSSAISAIGAVSNIVLASTRFTMIRSTDYGETWTQLDSARSLAEARSIVAINSTIFAGYGNGVGIYRSRDEGSSWAKSDSSIEDKRVQSLAVRGLDLFVATALGGIFRSTDDGVNWTAVNTGLTTTNIQHIAASGANLYAAAFGIGIFRSTNNGANWTAVNTGLTNLYPYTLAASGTNVYVWTSGGAFRSTDNGTRWEPMNTGIPASGTLKPGVAITAFAFTFNQSKLLAAVNGLGIVRSTDSGTSWSGANTGLKIVHVGAFAFQGKELFAGSYSGGGVFRSSDDGASWTMIDSGLTDPRVTALAVRDTDLFAGTVGGDLFRWSDDSTSWSKVASLLHRVNIFAVDSADLYAGTDDGLFRSTDGGNSWLNIDSSLKLRRYYSLAVADSGLFAGVGSGIGGVYRSTDRGGSWTKADSGMKGGSVYSLAARGTDLFAGTDSGVYRSTDYGRLWTRTGLTGVAVSALAIVDTNLFAGTRDSSFYRASADGTNWRADTAGMLDRHILALATNGSTLFAGTSTGVWSLFLSEPLSVEGPGVPSGNSSSLAQNYPNPFGLRTHFRFSVSASQFVSLQLFDPLGREVATLVNERLEPGTYTVAWDASGQASGTYYYRLKSEAGVQTKTLELSR